MLEALHFIFDASGSMRALGKQDILSLALHLLKTKFKHNSNAHFYYWGQNVYDHRAATPNFSGSANTVALCEFLDTLPDYSRLMLLSDGLFETDEIISQAKRKNILIFTTIIGSDADHLALKKIAAGKVYTVSDLPDASERLLRYLWEKSDA